jgi:uncharacterized membrane-anchored protein
MKEATKDANQERQKKGFDTVDLVGWAAPPRYDATQHKLYWAKELAFAGQSEHTVNYDIRMLGRRGVLVLTAVADMAHVKDIEAATPALLNMIDFKPGERYADFDGSTDKYAAYGLASLVAGGLAAKAGLFKVLLATLIAAKKAVLLGLVAVVSWFRRLFRRKRDEPQPERAQATSTLDPP